MAERRIVLVDSDPVLRKNIKAILTRMGYSVVGEAGEGMSALKLIRSRQPDLLIIEAQMSGMDGLEVARIVHEDKLAPVVALSSFHAPELLERAKQARVAALLIKPVDEVVLLPAIELALANYQDIISLEIKLKELKENLEIRKLIERAKGILMKTTGITESEAFRRMQRQSMNRRISMRQVAEAIILAENLGVQ